MVAAVPDCLRQIPAQAGDCCVGLAAMTWKQYETSAGLGLCEGATRQYLEQFRVRL